MELVVGSVATWASSGSGYGFGSGFGSGFGYGSGYGDGDGYGYGFGSGSGSGFGSGFDFGSGSGYGSGYGSVLKVKPVASIRIIAGRLSERGACADGVARFMSVFPNGAIYPDDFATAKAAGLDVAWIRNLGLPLIEEES